MCSIMAMPDERGPMLDDEDADEQMSHWQVGEMHDQPRPIHSDAHACRAGSMCSIESMPDERGQTLDDAVDEQVLSDEGDSLKTSHRAET